MAAVFTHQLDNSALYRFAGQRSSFSAVHISSKLNVVAAILSLLSLSFQLKSVEYRGEPLVASSKKSDKMYRKGKGPLNLRKRKDIALNSLKLTVFLKNFKVFLILRLFRPENASFLIGKLRFNIDP